MTNTSDNSYNAHVPRKMTWDHIVGSVYTFVFLSVCNIAWRDLLANLLACSLVHFVFLLAYMHKPSGN